MHSYTFFEFEKGSYGLSRPLKPSVCMCIAVWGIGIHDARRRNVTICVWNPSFDALWGRFRCAKKKLMFSIFARGTRPFIFMLVLFRVYVGSFYAFLNTIFSGLVRILNAWIIFFIRFTLCYFSVGEKKTVVSCKCAVFPCSSFGMRNCRFVLASVILCY